MVAIIDDHGVRVLAIVKQVADAEDRLFLKSPNDQLVRYMQVTDPSKRKFLWRNVKCKFLSDYYGCGYDEKDEETGKWYSPKLHLQVLKKALGEQDK